MATRVTRRESVKLDEILRYLFNVSKPALVAMLNGLFGESNDPDSVEIVKESARMINEQLEIIEGDMFLMVSSQLQKRRYHIEFQTLPDGRMGIRVLQYDMGKAVDIQRREQGGAGGKIRLVMPKSVVIHVEESKDVPDEYEVEIVFADGDAKMYRVPVMKYWTYSAAELVESGMYPLLPLRVFLLRSELDKATKADKSSVAKKQAIMRAKDAAAEVAKEAERLFREGSLRADDYNTIMNVVRYLFVYLNNRYKANRLLNKEVSEMLTTIKYIDTDLIDKGKIEAILDLLSDLDDYAIFDIAGEIMREKRDMQTLMKWLKYAASAGSVMEFKEKAGL